MEEAINQCAILVHQIGVSIYFENKRGILELDLLLKSLKADKRLSNDDDDGTVPRTEAERHPASGAKFE